MTSGGRAGICEAGPRWTELELQTDRTDSVEHLPALDGLRFLAALFVMFAHLPAAVFKTPTQSAWLSGTGTLAGLGMTTFFVLSGFVIHYNYRLISRQRGARLLWRFALARVARLYPLFLLVLGIDLLHAARVFPGNLDHAAHVLPFYITLTHAWTYGVSGDHSLIYQFGYLTAVSWSISVEVFFYVLYAFLAPGLRRLTSLRSVLLAGAGLYSVALLGYRAVTVHLGELNVWATDIFGPVADMGNGYQDSFVRWLLYFSPPARLMEFCLGCLAAHAYLCHRDVIRRALPSRGRSLHGWLLVGIVLGCHFLIYLSPLTYFRAGAALYAPLIVILIVHFAVESSGPSRLLSSGAAQRGGDCSYAIYLLHFVILVQYAQPHIPDTFEAWHLLVAKVGLLAALVVCVSRLVFVSFERPAREVIRGRSSLRDSAKSATRGLVQEWPALIGAILLNHALTLLDEHLLAIVASI